MTRTSPGGLSAAANETALVSVIIPTYNYAHFVTSAIDSVLTQSYSAIEIIVIDDGSTDRTADLLASRTDITYIHQENQGLSAARNSGIEAANGKYLLFLDADDLIGTASIRRRVERLEADKSLSAVVCQSAYFNKYTLPESIAFLHRKWRLPSANATDMALCFLNIAPPHAFLVRKEIIDRLRLRFDIGLRACEDYDFWFRLAVLTSLPESVRTTWVYYRQHAHSMSRSLANQAWHDAVLCKRILAAYDGSERWIGSRPKSNYLYPMFAAAVLTARKLWHADADKFPDFLSGHVTQVGQRLLRSAGLTNITAAEAFYIVSAKLTVLRMLVRDCSIDKTTYNALILSLPLRKECFTSALRSTTFHLQSSFDFIRFLKIEMHHVILSYFFRNRVNAR